MNIYEAALEFYRESSIQETRGMMTAEEILQAEVERFYMAYDEATIGMNTQAMMDYIRSKS